MALAYQPPVSDENGPLVIRPSWNALLRWELHIAAFFLLLMLFLAVKFKPVIFLPVLAVLLMFIGGYALYLTLYMLGTRITVTTDAILVTHWFGSEATVPTSDVAQVIRCSLNESRDNKGGWPRPAVLAFSPSGKCVLSLWAERWNQDDLDRIWRHLRVPTDTWFDTIRVADLRKRFPDAF